MNVHPTTRRICNAMLAVAVALSFAATGTPAARKPQAKRPKNAANPDSRRVVVEKSGALKTREGLRLRIITGLGDVQVQTADAADGEPVVSYQVRVETDARDPQAQDLVKQFTLSATAAPAGVQLTGDVPWRGFRGRLWVTYRVKMPRRYNLEVSTQAGNIETQDVYGRVDLVTLGGNITAGRIGAHDGSPRSASTAANPVARLETQGGHISVQDVLGDLRAITGGGHITAGNVQGDALLRSVGGNIRAGIIRGSAQIETGGGAIFLERAGGSVTASTGGGQIEFGEAVGTIHARTAGGCIRVLRVSGPMELESNGGSILLTQVRSGVRAKTGAGTITAWFSPGQEGLTASTLPALPGGGLLWSPPETPGSAPTPPSAPVARAGTPPPALLHGAAGKWKLLRPSELEAAQGDIVVYLPRELAATIEAVVEMGGEHRIEADPGLPLKLSYVDSAGGAKAVHGECAMNGGGELVKLKTTSGNIRLKLSDVGEQLEVYRQQFAEVQRRIALQQQRLYKQLLEQQSDLERQSQQQLQQRLAEVEQQLQPRLAGAPGAETKESDGTSSRLFNWPWFWGQFFSGAIEVDPEIQQKKIISSVSPAYPDLARQAGIEGIVRLRILVNKDGVVQEIRVLAGPKVLTTAAMDAVKQWRYQPTVVDGKAVSALSTVTIQFRLE